MDITFAVRLRATTTPRALSLLMTQLDARPEVARTVCVGAENGHPVVAVTRSLHGFHPRSSYEAWMELTLEVFDLLVGECPLLREAMPAADTWFPIVRVPHLEPNEYPAAVTVGQFGSFAMGWDGAVVAATADRYMERWVDIVCRAQAQWSATVSAIDASRAALRGSSEAAGSSESFDLLLEARADLVVALVELDARFGLYYEYEQAFVRALFDAFRMLDQLVLAERCMDAVSDLLAVRNQQAMLASQHTQERLARTASRWLFLVSLATGVSVILGAIEFVSSRQSPTVGNVVRLVVLGFCAIATALVFWRQNRAAAAARAAAELEEQAALARADQHRDHLM